MGATPAELGAYRWWRSTEGLFAEGTPAGVASWTDRIVGAVFAQPDTAARPQVAPAGGAGNGFPALNFLGANTTSLVLQTIGNLSQPYTFAMVSSTREGGRLQTMTKAVGGSAAGEFGLQADAAPARLRMFSGGTASSTDRLPLDTRAVAFGVFDGQSSRLILNGRQSGGSAGVRTATGTLHLGWDPATSANGNRSWNGLLWEFVVWDRRLSDAEVAQYDSYVQDRYGVQVADYVPPAQIRTGAGTTATRAAGSGSGAPARARAATAPARATGGGLGAPVRAGAGSPRATVLAGGVGAPGRVGAAAAGVTSRATGAGASARAAAGAASVATTVAGAGVARRTGTGTARSEVTVTGVGAPDEVRAGAGTASLTVTTAGAGQARRGAPGAARARTTSSGRGAPTRAGASGHVVRAAVSGQGATGRVGLATTGLAVTASGSGTHGADYPATTPDPRGFTRTHGAIPTGPVLTAPRVVPGRGWQAGWRAR